MRSFRSSRLESLFGGRLEAIDRAALERVIEVASEEGADLDFKASLYGLSDKDRGELAKDIAAMTDRGGVIVLGISETPDGTAGDLVELDADDSQANRMQQIVADRISPMPDVLLHPVRSQQGRGQWVIIIPPSPLAPHAVRWPGELGLRYYSRSGRTTRLLTESEVADRYRARSRAAQDQRNRLEGAEAEGVARLSRRGHSWLAMTLVPDRAGDFAISAAALEDHRRWCEEWQASAAQSRVDISATRAHTVGFRRIIVSADVSGVPEHSEWGHYELHTDGVAFGAVALGLAIADAFPNNAQVRARREHLVGQGELALAVLDMLSLLAGQASEFAGGSGDCVVATRLIPGGDEDGRLDQRPIELWEEHVVRGDRRVPGTRAISNPSRSRHSFSLSALGSSATDLIVAARAIVIDLLSDFGQANWNGWTEDGGVEPPDFGRSRQQYVAQWLRARAPEPTDT